MFLSEAVCDASHSHHHFLRQSLAYIEMSKPVIDCLPCVCENIFEQLTFESGGVFATSTAKITRAVMRFLRV